MRDFRNKTSVITGGASGIGLAISEALAREGSRIVLADIDEQALAEAEAKLCDTGAEVLAVRTDVAEAASVEALAKAALERFGAIHIVCNNAGVGQPLGPMWDRTLSDWQSALNVNLWGVIHGIRTFVPILLEQGTEAHVVNTASIAGLLSVPFLGLYCAAKHAVVALSEGLFAELAAVNSNVKVSVLCPGFVRTNIMQSLRNRPAGLADQGAMDPQLESAWQSAVDAGIQPAEVAAHVLAAIREERLYILTHPEYDDALRARAEDLILQQNPSAVDPARANA